MSLILTFALFVIITSWTVEGIPLWLALCNTIIGGFVVLLFIMSALSTTHNSANIKNIKNDSAKKDFNKKDSSNTNKPEDYM